MSDKMQLESGRVAAKRNATGDNVIITSQNEEKMAELEQALEALKAKFGTDVVGAVAALRGIIPAQQVVEEVPKIVVVNRHHSRQMRRTEVDLTSDIEREEGVLQKGMALHLVAVVQFHETLKELPATRVNPESIYEEYFIFLQSELLIDGIIIDKAQPRKAFHELFVCLLIFCKSKSINGSLLVNPENMIAFIRAFNKVQVENNRGSLAGFDTKIHFQQFYRNARFLRKKEFDKEFDGKILEKFGITSNLIAKYKELQGQTNDLAKQEWYKEIYTMFAGTIFPASEEEVEPLPVNGDDML